MTNYIYLLQEREFVKTNENIYKVGMTKKENYERFNQYPKGSILLFQMICNDCNNIEKCVLKIFREKFKQRKDIGNEYFEGDYRVMIDIIHLKIKNEYTETFSELNNDKIDSNHNFNEWKNIYSEILTEKTLELKCKINADEYKINTIFRSINNQIIIYINNDLEINISDEKSKDLIDYTTTGLKYLLSVKVKENNLIKNDDNIFIEEFKKSFEIIEDENERQKYYIKTIKLSEWARLKNLKIYTSKSINKLLFEKLNYDCNNKLLYKYKKIDNKSILCWIGLKEKENKIS